MVGTWMLWQNGWGVGGRYYGWDLDALAERMGSGWTISWWDLDALAERMRSGWTISWLGPGCSGRTDGVWVDDIMVGTWMLWQNGWGLGGRYHGWDLDALAERMGSGWTISWLGPGCSGRTDGVWVWCPKLRGSRTWAGGGTEEERRGGQTTRSLPSSSSSSSSIVGVGVRVVVRVIVRVVVRVVRIVRVVVVVAAAAVVAVVTSSIMIGFSCTALKASAPSAVSR